MQIKTEGYDLRVDIYINGEKRESISEKDKKEIERAINRAMHTFYKDGTLDGETFEIFTLNRDKGDGEKVTESEDEVLQ